jgi:membrane associated rhomboid family serine protease
MRKAPIHTIIVPHFTWKSITFWMSVVMLVLFLTLVIVYASRDKSDVAWSCLMFETQNKFYPRLRYNYQFWRIPISALFHGNISHVVLNLIGLQIYGYFVEWYYGRLKYLLVLLATIINAHLLSCLTNVVSVSSTASGVLYAFIGLKIMFFIKYRNYKPLENRRAPIYSLFALIFAMNLVVLFVGSNVDVGGHVGNDHQ